MDITKQLEDQFVQMLSETEQAIRKYDSLKIKYIPFIDELENIFANYGWKKADFYKELDFKLGLSKKSYIQETVNIQTKKKSSAKSPLQF